MKLVIHWSCNPVKMLHDKDTVYTLREIKLLHAVVLGLLEALELLELFEIIQHSHQ